MKYEIIEYKGQEARLYPDGSIRNDKGWWLAKHPDGKENFSPEIAAAYRARATHDRQQAAMYGVANAIQKGIGAGVPLGTSEAWAMATELLAEGLFSDKYRDRADTMRVLSDITPSKYDKTVQVQQQTATNQVPAQPLAVLLQVIVNKDDDQTVIEVDAE